MYEYYPIFVALGFNALDMVTGLIAAVKIKDIKSAKLRDGLFKKVGFILCYLVAWMVDTNAGLIGFKVNVDILPVIILYVCTTECVSVLENICQINPDLLPGKLMDLFHISHEK